MRYFFSVLALMWFSALPAQNVKLAWANKIGGASYDEGLAVAVDISGNTYTTGHFKGTVDFDPGPATYNITSTGYADMFVCKSGISGNLIWAKDMGGLNSYIEGSSILVDASGYVYITGYFQGTVDFDPGPETYDLTSAGSDDIFISKLNASGDFLWSKKIGGDFLDAGTSLVVDVFGNVYTTGCFQATVDFDPGTNICNLSAGGSESLFISKLDASGSFIWAKTIGGTSENDFINSTSITLDTLGNLYTTGGFGGTVDFDPGVLTHRLNAVGQDIFISKLDASGNFVWVKNMGGDTKDDRFGNFITIDVSGNIFTTGSFQGTADFDPGPGTYNLKSIGIYDVFISKLDSLGNFAWAKNLGSPGQYAEGLSIKTDGSRNVYTVGYFEEVTDFDPGAEVYNLKPSGEDDVFVSKLDASGNFVWAKNMGGDSSNSTGESLAVDAYGNVFITGEFTETVDFDPGGGTYHLTSSGEYDIFILKLSQAVFWNGSTGNVWSNPANWEGGVIPGVTDDVEIPSEVINYPTVFSSTEIKSLSLQTGAVVTVAPNVNLKINGK